MLCVMGVYLGDITYTIFVILHLNVCRLGICNSYEILVHCIETVHGCYIHCKDYAQYYTL